MGGVTFRKNSIVYGRANIGPSLEGEEAWWYVRNSFVKKAEDVADNENGWWYVKDGRVDFGFTGLKENKNGWWYIRNGKVDFGWKSIEENEYGWWCIHGGKVDFGYTGLERRVEDDKWYYIKGGLLDRGYNGLAFNDGKWYYMEKGELNWGYNGKAYIPGSKLEVQVVNGTASYTPDVPSKDLLNAAGYTLNYAGWNLRAAYNASLMPWTVYDVDGNLGIGHYARYGLQNHHGNCYVMASTFVTLARTMGYKAQQMSGYVPTIYGGQSPHSWTEVYHDGAWHVFDPDFEAEGHGNGYDFVYGTPGTWRYGNYYPMHN